MENGLQAEHWYFSLTETCSKKKTRKYLSALKRLRLKTNVLQDSYTSIFSLCGITTRCFVLEFTFFVSSKITFEFYVATKSFLFITLKHFYCLTDSSMVKHTMRRLSPSSFCFSSLSRPWNRTELFSLQVKPRPASKGVSSGRRSACQCL